MHSRPKAGDPEGLLPNRERDIQEQGMIVVPTKIEDR